MSFKVISNEVKESRSCLLNTWPPHGASAVICGRGLEVFCWFSSFLGEVNGQPLLAVRANSDLLFGPAENPTPPGSSQSILLLCRGCCLDKTLPELLIVNNNISAKEKIK